ncbi:MAG: hypothetical protein AAB462_04075 [Patescibacteria group bacterium]
MNPHNSEASSIELPPPMVEQAVPNAGAELAQQSPELAANAERSGSVQSAPPSGGAAAIPMPVPPMMQTAVPAPAAGTPAPIGGMPILDDGDLIEKEWVNKAKQIVERTRDDPHKQSEELTVVKADYMKKRYGKTIKLSQ